VVLLLGQESPDGSAPDWRGMPWALLLELSRALVLARVVVWSRVAVLGLGVSSFGPLASSFGPWAVSFGPWALSFGPWALSFGPSAFGPSALSFGSEALLFGLGALLFGSEELLLGVFASSSCRRLNTFGRGAAGRGGAGTLPSCGPGRFDRHPGGAMLVLRATSTFSVL
jgi:hypothetical protein